MKAVIRFEQDHLVECTKSYIKVFNAEPWNDQWTQETAYQRLKDIFIAPNFEGIICIDDGIVKGAILGNWEQFYDGKHYNLREMFVDNDLQGTDIGSRMLGELEGILVEKGVTTTILFTSKGNKTSEFYLKNGFVEWTSMAMMGKELSRLD